MNGVEGAFATEQVFFRSLTLNALVLATGFYPSQKRRDTRVSKLRVGGRRSRQVADQDVLGLLLGYWL